MKTAISIDDSLLQKTDQAARSMGLSRSRLVAIAVTDFLERRRQEEMLRSLNEVYADKEPTERHLLKGMKAKFAKTLRNRW
jgi:metal-responsive CopG/Arc/MetJ family transcriptional regulator